MDSIPNRSTRARANNHIVTTPRDRTPRGPTASAPRPTPTQGSKGNAKSHVRTLRAASARQSTHAAPPPSCMCARRDHIRNEYASHCIRPPRAAAESRDALAHLTAPDTRRRSLMRLSSHQCMHDRIRVRWGQEETRERRARYSNVGRCSFVARSLSLIGAVARCRGWSRPRKRGLARAALAAGEHRADTARATPQSVRKCAHGCGARRWQRAPKGSSRRREAGRTNARAARSVLSRAGARGSTFGPGGEGCRARFGRV